LQKNNQKSNCIFFQSILIISDLMGSMSIKTLISRRSMMIKTAINCSTYRWSKSRWGFQHLLILYPHVIIVKIRIWRRKVAHLWVIIVGISLKFIAIGDILISLLCCRLRLRMVEGRIENVLYFFMLAIKFSRVGILNFRCFVNIQRWFLFGGIITCLKFKRIVGFTRVIISKIMIRQIAIPSKSNSINTTKTRINNIIILI